jgi:hypothetical protein
VKTLSFEWEWGGFLVEEEDAILWFDGGDDQLGSIEFSMPVSDFVKFARTVLHQLGEDI